MSETVLDRLASVLRAAMDHNRQAFEDPVALLWPDESSSWQPAVDRLAQRLPIVVLGEYDPGRKRGPAYWVRCVVAGTLDVGLPDGVPIVYLPGVARSELRAVDSCPPELAPIAELQYRSQEFTQPKSRREWSLRALLVDRERGLSLTVTNGATTAEALRLALDRLLDERVDGLANQVLDVDYFNQLVNPDPTSVLLGWLDDPAGYRERLNNTEWVAFVGQCKSDWDFNPEDEGPITAARLLGSGSGKWSVAWKRFASAPERYAGIADRLRQARPDELLPEHRESWPQENEQDENRLRGCLRDFEALTPDEARQKAIQLDAQHAWRRATVWAELGDAPLAFAVEQLALLGELTANEPPGDLSAIVAAYTGWGWRADDAVLRALDAVTAAEDRAAVGAAVTAIYRPWLDAWAAALQSAIGPMANADTYESGTPVAPAPGVVEVFVDGLRLDVAHRVQDRLCGAAMEVELSTSFAPLPTVTETAKPAVAPLAEGTLQAGSELYPANAATGTKASIQVLRALMDEAGIQVLGSTDVGDPAGSAWTEVGEIDHRGHDVGIRLVEYLDVEVDRIVGRIRELLDAGWKRVEVVTDHGWLLLPVEMEKVALPVAVTETKKGRCARLKDGAAVEVPTVPWFWDNNARIAVAPGVTCFEAGKNYEHGGVSPQECVVPRLTTTLGAEQAATGGPEITKITWLGLLCRIELSGVSSGISADIRGLPGDSATSIADAAKETGGAGKVSLVVPDEDHEGERAHVVLVGADGNVVAQREVIVGQNR